MTIVREDDDGSSRFPQSTVNRTFSTRFESVRAHLGRARRRSPRRSRPPPRQPARRRGGVSRTSGRGSPRTCSTTTSPDSTAHQSLATDHRAPRLRSRGRGVRVSSSTTTNSIRGCSTVSRTAISNHGKPSSGNVAVPPTVAGATTRCRRLNKPPLQTTTTGARAVSNRSLFSRTVIQELAQPTERDFDDGHRPTSALAAATADQVDAFRQQVDARLSTLEGTRRNRRCRHGFKDTLPRRSTRPSKTTATNGSTRLKTFRPRLRRTRNRWLRAGRGTPHLDDLFRILHDDHDVYFDRRSDALCEDGNRILFMNDYFGKFEDAGQSQIGDTGCRSASVSSQS